MTYDESVMLCLQNILVCLMWFSWLSECVTRYCCVAYNKSAILCLQNTLVWVIWFWLLGEYDIGYCCVYDIVCEYIIGVVLY